MRHLNDPPDAPDWHSDPKPNPCEPVVELVVPPNVVLGTE